MPKKSNKEPEVTAMRASKGQLSAFEKKGAPNIVYYYQDDDKYILVDNRKNKSIKYTGKTLKELEDIMLTKVINNQG